MSSRFCSLGVFRMFVVLRHLSFPLVNLLVVGLNQSRQEFIQNQCVILSSSHHQDREL
jgi:hypothetical protein